MFNIEQTRCSQLDRTFLRKYVALSKTLFAVECVMHTNERQIALSVLEGLRGD